MTKSKLKIALLSSERISVPPPKYGGTELIVYNLAEGLVKLGHDVTVFSTGDSKISAKLEFTCRKSGFKFGLPASSSAALVHAAYSFDKIKGAKFDVIHNHYSLWGIGFAKVLGLPVVSTYHGAFANDFGKIELKCFEKLADQSDFISISHSQTRNTSIKLNWIANVYNGINVNQFEYNDKPDDYFVWLGRFFPMKGAKESILAAKEAGVKLRLAGMLSRFHEQAWTYFQREIKPLIDNKQIKYVGEVDHKAKVQLLKNAKGLLNPIKWEEPFGLVMTEAMACGTPVIANKRGSVPEVVQDGRTGFITKTQNDIVKAIGNINQINRLVCRKRVEKCFSAKVMVKNYERVYYQLNRRK